MSVFDERRLRPRRPALPWLVRGALVLMAAVWLGVFGIAFIVNPYKDGKVWLEGSHRQLGFPPCTFKELTKLPCPSCGMTSSFALAVRGDLWHSVQANFLGTALVVAGLALVPWGVMSAVKGRILLPWFWRHWSLKLLVGFFILMFVRWGVVLALAYWDL